MSKPSPTIAEAEFLLNHLIKGLTLGESYKRFNPETIQDDKNCTRSGWARLKRIKAKIGSWSQVYTVAGLGPAAIAGIFNEALKANKKDEADHTTRLRAAGILAEIHGLTNESPTITDELPLPLVVIVNGAEVSPTE